jgi:ankyrin repeat protein
MRRAAWLVVVLCGVAAVVARAADAPIADAAEKGDWARVRTLVKEGADVKGAQADGMTALHWAAHHDEVGVVKELMAKGAVVGAENRYGVTALSLACVNGDGELVRVLLAGGADANGALRGGETVLMTAARVGKVDAVKALLEAGAKVDAKERGGQTALMWAAAEGHAEVVRVLVGAGADVRGRLKSGFTPMLFAARDGRIEVVRVLLKAAVSADEAIETERKGTGTTPGSGVSALSLAVENGHFELALELVKAGADPNDQRSGYTALHRLTWVRKPNRGDDPDGQPPPAGSGKVNSLEFAREMVARGARVNERLARGPSGKGKLNLTGATACLMASRTADLAYMRLLVELGADPKIPNKDGCTALMAAAGIGCLAPDEEAGTEEECLAAVEYLVGLGLEVNTVDGNGETAMHGAAYKSLPKMVQSLADKGAKIEVWNRKDKYGWTPLMIAEGFRPGNFKPSAETIGAIHRVMRAAGVAVPAPTPRTATTGPYEGAK